MPINANTGVYDIEMCKNCKWYYEVCIAHTAGETHTAGHCIKKSPPFPWTDSFRYCGDFEFDAKNENEGEA